MNGAMMVTSVLMMTYCSGYRNTVPRVHISGHVWCRDTHHWTSPDNTSGVITSPNYPSPYTPPRGQVTDCIWYITAPPHHIIRIEFTAFLLDPPCHDYVELYKGNSHIRGNFIGKRLCRRDIPLDPITTPSNKLEMYFHADRRDSYKGFRAEFTFINTAPTTTTRRLRAPHHPVHTTTTTRLHRITTTTPTPLVSSAAPKPHPPTARLVSYAILGVIVAMVGISDNV